MIFSSPNERLRSSGTSEPGYLEAELGLLSGSYVPLTCVFLIEHSVERPVLLSVTSTSELHPQRLSYCSTNLLL